MERNEAAPVSDRTDHAEDEGIADFFRARLLLFQLELREATQTFRKLSIYYLGVVVFAVLAYVFLAVALVGFGSRALGWSWDVVALAAALAHGIGVGVFLLLIRRARKQQPFRESLNQLEKDRQWLESKTEPPKN